MNLISLFFEVPYKAQWSIQEKMLKRGSHLETLDTQKISVKGKKFQFIGQPKHTLFTSFLSTARWIYKRLFFSVTSSNKVNIGQLMSITINWVQLRYVHPSVHRSVSATYVIDEEMDKKRSLIDLPCSLY